MSLLVRGMKNLKKYKDKDLIAFIASIKEPEKSHAFSELYDRYSRKIYLYCKKIFGEEGYAEDIFQDTFIQLLKSIENNVQIDNINGYLLKTARNLSINFKRKNKVEIIEYDDLNYFINDRAFELQELSELLDSALDLLPVEHKEAFILQTYYGLSYSEIANLTEVPLTTVRNRVVRAKFKLREILSPILEVKN